MFDIKANSRAIMTKCHCNNFGLSFHLPKDIVNIVLDYVYKPDITKLNQEYKLFIRYDSYSDYIKLIHTNNTFIFNYRRNNWINDIITSIYNMRKTVSLPKNYWYTSGCDELDRYEMKTK